MTKFKFFWTHEDMVDFIERNNIASYDYDCKTDQEGFTLRYYDAD